MLNEGETTGLYGKTRKVTIKAEVTYEALIRTPDFEWLSEDNCGNDKAIKKAREDFPNKCFIRDITFINETVEVKND